MQRRNGGVSRERPSKTSVGGAGSWLGRSVLCSTAVALLFAVDVPAGRADNELQLSDLRVLIEINGTDGDAGFQAEIDGDAWRVLNLFNPNERRIYRVRGFRSVAAQGLTENFFESAEPSCADVPLDVVLGRFPEGEYEAEGWTIDGQAIEGEAILEHALPAIPVNLAATNDAPVDLEWDWPGDAPDLGECPDELGLAKLVVNEDDLFGFQIVVGREEPEPLVELVIELGPGARTVDLPEAFIEADATYQWEVIAIGAGVDPETGEIDPDRRGNQVIAEDEFCTNSDGLVDECPEAE